MDKFTTCAIKGCDGKIQGYALCSHHYHRWRTYGHPLFSAPGTRETPKERFWKRVDKRGPDECWEWKLKKDSGYGKFCINGVSYMAHRISYEWGVGPIPPGFHIDHLCRNRSCVNPAHLEPVTMVENVRRGFGPSAINSRKTHCPLGHPLSGDNLYAWRGQRLCKACRAIKRRRRTERDRLSKQPKSR